MDRLDRLLPTAGPLLRRIDDILGTGGAPPEHQVWEELRRVRLLPGDAVRAVAALRPDDLLGAAPELRADAQACTTLASSLPGPGEWTGAAADAYDTSRRRAAVDLSGDAESLDARLAATADLADALADWMRTARDAVAGALAEALTSAEALTLGGPTADPASSREPVAAAEVAALVLRAVAAGSEAGADLLHRSARLSESLPTP